MNWVCRPGKPGACHDDLATQVILADGSGRIEAYAPAKAPKADCFYVYPTVSHSPGASALPGVSEDERRAVRQQFERLGSICRLYAPFYRQTTATAMERAIAGQTVTGMDEADRIAQADVAAAWDTYLARYNHGRGVILIGHSQGAGILRDLMRRQIDGRPVQARLISAVLPGAWVRAPRGLDVGGTFKSIPACRRVGQIGCVFVFNTVRADHPIPLDQVQHFDDGSEQLCTNPAALTGGPGVLKPYLSATGETIIPELTAPQPDWTKPRQAIRAPFVTTPGLFTAECRIDEHGAVLAVWPTPQPGDRRTGDLTGDWISNGKVEATMGLHLIDLNLTMGNLVEMLREQIDAYQSSLRRSS